MNCSPEKAQIVAQQSVESAIADVFDADAVRHYTDFYS
jgi:hypothetical protein